MFHLKENKVFKDYNEFGVKRNYQIKINPLLIVVLRYVRLHDPKKLYQMHILNEEHFIGVALIIFSLSPDLCQVRSGQSV